MPELLSVAQANDFPSEILRFPVVYSTYLASCADSYFVCEIKIIKAEKEEEEICLRYSSSRYEEMLSLIGN